MAAITKPAEMCSHFVRLYIQVGHQYTKLHAYVNMQTKVMTILSFKWWPF